MMLGSCSAIMHTLMRFGHAVGVLCLWRPFLGQAFPFTARGGIEILLNLLAVGVHRRCCGGLSFGVKHWPTPLSLAWQQQPWSL